MPRMVHIEVIGRKFSFHKAIDPGMVSTTDNAIGFIRDAIGWLIRRVLIADEMSMGRDPLTMADADRAIEDSRNVR